MLEERCGGLGIIEVRDCSVLIGYEVRTSVYQNLIHNNSSQNNIFYFVVEMAMLQ